MQSISVLCKQMSEQPFNPCLQFVYFRRHMKAHNKEKYVDVDNLSQPQLIMQHFRNFDLDKNGKIDGLEILKAAANMNGKYIFTQWWRK